MQARCLSVYSGSLEQEATASATAINTQQVRRGCFMAHRWSRGSRVNAPNRLSVLGCSNAKGDPAGKPDTAAVTSVAAAAP
jgi:hypothetical protein